MRRRLSVFFFVLLLVATFGVSIMAGADQSTDRKVLGQITAYTTLPTETAAILADEYERESRIRVNFIPLAAENIENRLQTEIVTDEKGLPQKTPVSLVLADSRLLERAAGKGYVVPYESETSDSVPKNFKQENGFWTGIWYDPMVFAVNADYMKTVPRTPNTWQELAEFDGARIGVTDFVAADAPQNLLYSMIARFGDKQAYGVWRGIHGNVVQYAKYLSTPVRQTGMGEVDISVAVASEAMRYMENGYPLKIVYPADGTSYMLTGTAIIANAAPEDRATAQKFADWLLGDEAQLALQKNGFYFIPTNPDTVAYKNFGGRNLVLFDEKWYYTAQERHDFLDRWMKYIRFQ